MTYSDYASLFIGVKQGSTKHKLIVNRYNDIKPLPRGYKVKYSDAWCATFTSFILVSCGCKRKVYECSVERMRKKCNRYLISDNIKGKTNDLIFYDWNNDTWCDHVGIIYKVDSKNYYVIEGNKDKRVGTRTISKKSKYIYSIARL